MVPSQRKITTFSLNVPGWWNDLNTPIRGRHWCFLWGMAGTSTSLVVAVGTGASSWDKAGISSSWDEAGTGASILDMVCTGALSGELVGTGAFPGDAGRHWCSFLSFSEEDTGTGALLQLWQTLVVPSGALGPMVSR